MSMIANCFREVLRICGREFTDFRRVSFKFCPVYLRVRKFIIVCKMSVFGFSRVGFPTDLSPNDPFNHFILLECNGGRGPEEAIYTTHIITVVLNVLCKGQTLQVNSYKDILKNEIIGLR